MEKKQNKKDTKSVSFLFWLPLLGSEVKKDCVSFFASETAQSKESNELSVSK